MEVHPCDGAAATTETSSRTCILVLGMHRAGDGALARVLNQLGAASPTNPVPPAGDDGRPGLQPSRLVHLHDRMLKEAGSGWDDWRSLDLDVLGPGRRAHYGAEIGRLITEAYGQAPLFVVSDPRICRFVPLYEEALAQIGVDAGFVVAPCNPLAPGAAPARHDQMTANFARLVWLRHALDAEASTRGKRRLLLSREAFLEDWRDAVGRIGEALRLDWPRGVEDAAPEVDTFLSGESAHRAPELPDDAPSGKAGQWIEDAHGALLALSRQDRDGEATATLDRVRAEFEPMAATFGPAVYPELAARREHFRGLLAVVRHRMETVSLKLRTTGEQLAARNREVAEISSRARSQQERIRALSRHLREAGGPLAADGDAFAAAEARDGMAAQQNGRDETGVETPEGDAGEQAAAPLPPAAGRRWAAAPRLLGRLREMLFRLDLHAGLELELLPLHDIAAEPADAAAGKWTVTGGDPHFELKWTPAIPLGPGRYQLWLQMPQGWGPLVNSRLYVDSGDGYSEPESLALRGRLTRGGHPRAAFSLPRGARRLRFDPSESNETVHVGRARLRRLTRLEYYMRLAGRAYRRKRQAGMSLAAAARLVLSVLRQGGVRGLAERLRGLDMQLAPSSEADYEQWIARFDTWDDAMRADLTRRIEGMARRPLISVVMPVYNTPEKLLVEAIESVRAQVYENWELCIADDRSTRPQVRRVLEDYARRDPRIKVVYREENGHISHATNSAFALAGGEWVALLDHDDLLRPQALAEVALEIDRHPDAELIYSDEDKIGPDGKRRDPYFKPDFSRQLFRSQNYLNHLTVHRAENIRAVGGWRPGFEGSQDYDLTLRIFERVGADAIRHIPKILYHWRAVEGSTAAAGSEKDYAWAAGMRALKEHVQRLGLPATVERAPETPFYRMHFAVPEPRPRVSLVIPTRDKVDILRNCITSIRDKTTYADYEIIVVDNGSRERATHAYFKDIARAANIRVLRYDKPFNYPAINNFAVKRAKGDIVGLVNNDVEVISPGWLEEMVSWAVQPDIGCVGAKLYYGDDTIQHAGVILGIGGVAGHSHKGFPRDHNGYFCRLKVLQDLSAVTAACLLVRKSVYEEVGGLNEKNLKVAFNDVDFCLKVRKAGYLNVWTPYAELYHLESISRGLEDNPERIARFNAEAYYMKKAWGRQIESDPFYSINLTSVREDFSLS